VEGAIDTYLETVHKQFRMHATWPPGALVGLGDIGVLRNGAFVPTSNLKERGFRFGKEKREAPAVRFASSGGVKFEGSASGKTDTAISAIAKLDAGLKIRFTKEGAIVFVMDPAADEFIRDVDSVAEWMLAERGKKMKRDQVVITHIRRAGSGVIAMASSGGGEVQLKTNAKIGKGPVTLADLKGTLELVTSTETEFVSVPRGRSGTTPLYRMLHYDHPTFWERIIGRDTTVAMRMHQDIGLFPAPEAVRGERAMRSPS
jgi:hypothetical protein